MTQHQCDIAIIGASFAGLSAYLMLRKKLGNEVDIRIFDMRETFTYIPGLHECLGDTSRLEKLQFSLQDVYRDAIIIEQVKHIDTDTLTLESGNTRSFSYAVIATGSKPQFFKNKQREKNGYTLRWAEDVSKLNTVLPDATTVTVIGGGITGVETASVLKQRRPEKTIQLVHSRSFVLHNMWEYTSKKAHTYLEKQWVVMLCGERLQDVYPDYIVLADGSTHTSDVTIISAGVTADDAAHEPYLTFDGSYTAEEWAHIYLAGDVAMHGLLPTAHNAFFEGRAAGACIAKKRTGQEHVYPQLHNRTNLAIALGTKDGIMTFWQHGIYLPRYTGFAKRIVEKRVMFEFTRKIMLPI